MRGKTRAAASFHRVGRLFALADRLEVRSAKVRGQVRAKSDTSSGLGPVDSPAPAGSAVPALPSGQFLSPIPNGLKSPRSRRRRESLGARGWTPSQPARSGCAFSLRKSRLACSQHSRLATQLVSRNPTDEPAEKSLERIKTNHDLKSRRDAQQWPSDSSLGLSRGR